MNNGLEGIKKEAVIAVSRHCPSIYMAELRKTTKNLKSGWPVSQPRFKPSNYQIQVV
jgi:hypothetical protein